LPVVALDAPGVREVGLDKENGRLLRDNSVVAFSAALKWMSERTPQQRHALQLSAITYVTAALIAIISGEED